MRVNILVLIQKKVDRIMVDMLCREILFLVQMYHFNKVKL